MIHVVKREVQATSTISMPPPEYYLMVSEKSESGLPQGHHDSRTPSALT